MCMVSLPVTVVCWLHDCLSDVPVMLEHRRTKEQDWQRKPEVHINSLSAIL